ncbi:MerR family transcriptional regulator [Streptomyces sp. NPDC048527]|uniref:MerR family transcriptional regulator n=1 Tax=Streptomyces sp. NPDC048527 TaxID=3365568 RepID=UPI00370F8413
MSIQRMRPMTVGELSRRTGVRVKTLREYTDLGLIYTLGRSPANYRLFTTDALWYVHQIGELRGLGLTVAEIRELATTWLDGADQASGARLAELLHRSRERLERRIAGQQQTLRRIEEFEAVHRADLAVGDFCFSDGPRGGVDA